MSEPKSCMVGGSTHSLKSNTDPISGFCFDFMFHVSFDPELDNMEREKILKLD